MGKLVMLILVHLLFYLFGSFIAWDFNPLNWWLFTSWVGRGLFLIFEIYGVGNYLSDD
jgi:hypothetical protein